MKHRDKIVMATILAGSIGLAGLGVSRAQTADTTTATIDTAVTATATTTPTTPTVGRGMRHAERMAELAEKFGMTTTELKTAIESGKEMYQIAAEHGVTFAEEKAERLAELKTRLDDMVKVGYLTQAEADAAYNEAKDSAMIGGLGFGGPHGRH